MSCERNRRLGAGAARSSGLPGYLSQAVGAFASWNTVAKVMQGGLSLESLQKNTGTALKDLGQDVANVGLDSLGLRLDRQEDDKLKLKLTGPAALMLATHALEQSTGSLATLGLRALGGGKAYARYRGVVLRQPKSTQKGKHPDDYYFHQGGLTWIGRSRDFTLFGEKKTLTQVASLSLPNRSYYFDRKIEAETMVDVVLGSRQAEHIPGYLGQTNEIDALVPPLKQLKTSLVGLAWLTQDSSERDLPDTTTFDYRQLNQVEKPDPAQVWRQSLRHPATQTPAYPSRPNRDSAYQAALDSLKSKPASASEAKPQAGEKIMSDQVPDLPSLSQAQADADIITLPVQKLYEGYQPYAQKLGPLHPSVVYVEGQGIRPLKITNFHQTLEGWAFVSAQYEDKSGRWQDVNDSKIRLALANTIVQNLEKLPR